jgi:hypothetical protein
VLAYIVLAIIMPEEPVGEVAPPPAEEEEAGESE